MSWEIYVCPECGAWAGGEPGPIRAPWCDGACSHPRRQMEVVRVVRDVSPGGSASCNICGVEWPNHDEACAYVGTARDLNACREDLRKGCVGGPHTRGTDAECEYCHDRGVTLKRARCCQCGRKSAPVVTGTSPWAWKRLHDPSDSSVTYLCDQCKPR